MPTRAFSPTRRSVLGAISLLFPAWAARAKAGGLSAWQSGQSQLLAQSLARLGESQPEVVLPDRGGTRWRLAGSEALDPKGEGQWWFAASDSRRWRLAENPVRPEHLGATGLGDEHAILQQWANLLGDGVHGRLDTDHIAGAQITFAGRRNFTLAGDGRVTMAPGTPVQSGYSVLVFTGCQDFEVSGITVDGNRARRAPREVPAHNIQFLSCQRFKVDGVMSLNAVVDGFYLASSRPLNVESHCSDFVFDDCRTDGCFRQGMSIIQGHRGTIRKCVFENTRGTPPQAGVDLESNEGNPAGSIESITFDQCRFAGNAGYGLQVSYMSLPRDIEVTGCAFDGNGKGPILWGAASGTIADCEFAGSRNKNIIRTTGRKGDARFLLVRPRIVP